MRVLKLVHCVWFGAVRCGRICSPAGPRRWLCLGDLVRGAQVAGGGGACPSLTGRRAAAAGTGKTHTAFGSDAPDGLGPQCGVALLSRLEERSALAAGGLVAWVLHASAFEVLEEGVRDLLREGDAPRRRPGAPPGFGGAVRALHVASAGEVHAVVRAALSRRAVDAGAGVGGALSGGVPASRGHLVLVLAVSRVEADGSVKYAPRALAAVARWAAALTGGGRLHRSLEATLTVADVACPGVAPPPAAGARVRRGDSVRLLDERAARARSHAWLIQSSSHLVGCLCALADGGGGGAARRAMDAQPLTAALACVLACDGCATTFVVCVVEDPVRVRARVRGCAAR